MTQTQEFDFPTAIKKLAEVRLPNGIMPFESATPNHSAFEEKKEKKP